MRILAEKKPRLTLREREIINLIATGLSAKEAAAELDIAPRTVEGHLENCRHKFGARNRTHLIVQCASMGFIQIEQSDDSKCGTCVFRQFYQTDQKLNLESLA